LNPAVDIVPPEIDRYAEEHTAPPPDGLLTALAEETRATLPIPQMLTGTVEGRLLELLVHAIGATRVLELGTYSGYSALSMATGLPPGGHIDTCEIEERHADVARRYIAQSEYANRITVHLGPALETIERLGGTWDFVFIDADKDNYVSYYEAVVPRLSERGLIAADNTLWSGRVLDDRGSDGQGPIVRFNEHVRRDPRVRSVLLTIRDGVTLIRRA
jgi:caffeoyl-CoA O-methyltransferase